MANQKRLPKYRCKRCGHQWTPRTPKPKYCTRCKSPYWNKERRQKKSTTL